MEREKEVAQGELKEAEQEEGKPGDLKVTEEELGRRERGRMNEIRWETEEERKEGGKREE